MRMFFPVLLTLFLASIARAELPELRHSTNYFPKPHSIRLQTQQDGRVEVTIDRNTCVYDPEGIPTCTHIEIEVLLVEPRPLESVIDQFVQYELTPGIIVLVGSEELFVLTTELSEGIDEPGQIGWKRLRLYPSESRK